MANSTITITFNEDFIIGSTIDLIGYWLSDTGTTVHRGNNWVNTRSYNGQVTVGTPTSIPGERTAINYVQAFTLDYGASFTIVRTGSNIVLITAKDIEWRTVAVSAYKSTGVNADITYSYSNTTDTAFNIISTTFSSGTVPCQNISISVQTTSLAAKIISPILVNANTNNPFSFEWLRGQTINIVVENSAGVQTSKTVVLPSLLSANNFTYSINNSPAGATVVVINIGPSSGLTLQYSLDNVVWQSSSTFSGLASGNHTVYIKDQYGCSVSKTLHIDELGIQSPYFYISKSNSIRFANRISFGDSENYKNDENTLSNEAFSKDPSLAYQEIQQFQSADIITTQFKSNYDSNVATIVKSDLSEVDIPIVKMTNNIGIKDRRDAVKYYIGGGKTGVYFLSGNTYHYDTNAVTGTYALNGALPEWAQVGSYIQVNTTWFLIEDIIFDETKNAEVVIYANTPTGPDGNVIVGTVFNRFNYEVYEFTFDMVDYIDQYFRVRINNTDNTFTEIVHLSELIWCKVKHDKVLEIRYRNSSNTDMFYATGITNVIRIPITNIKGKVNEENDIHKTDTTSILLSSELYEVDEFLFEPVTKEIWRKLMQALSHETVTLNGVGYVKNGEFNTEGPLDDSNLYVLTAAMIKTGSVYNSQASGGNDFSGSEVEVPGLIQTDTGFVSYI